MVQQSDGSGCFSGPVSVLLESYLNAAVSDPECVDFEAGVQSIASALQAAPDGERVKLLHAATDYFMASLNRIDSNGQLIVSDNHMRGMAAIELAYYVIDQFDSYDDAQLAEILDRTERGYRGTRFVGIILRRIENWIGRNSLSSRLKSSLARWREHRYEEGATDCERRHLRKVEELLGMNTESALAPGDAWSNEALQDLADIKQTAAYRGQATQSETGPSSLYSRWCAVLVHAGSATKPKPPKDWLNNAVGLLDSLGRDEFLARTSRWFQFVGRPGTEPALRSPWTPPDPRLLADRNIAALCGLIWMYILLDSPAAVRVLGGLTSACLTRIPGRGALSAKAANACIYALSEMTAEDAVAELSRLVLLKRLGPVKRSIELARVRAAEKRQISESELDELVVPHFGLTDVGLRRETLGGHPVELRVDGASAELRFFKPDGKPLKSAPAAVRRDRAEDLKELKQAAADIQKMLPAQRERLDGLYLAQRSWAYPVWRERYLDHPLVGVLARRLIWRLRDDTRCAEGIFHDGRLVDADGRALDWAGDRTRVELWHPMMSAAEQVLGWRRWLEAHEVRQPFKQAHREIYVLTDAERNTRVYSNRFAAHILRQHQFNALCAVRRWKNRLRLMVDDEYPPATRALPQWGLRAEFWIEGIGEEYGIDTNETGVFLRVASDQVRFYRTDAAQMTAHAGGGGYGHRYAEVEDQALPLEEVPPLVFSEIMRDVDLFVGVASVGNDPTWADGGPDGRFREYWTGYAFGELAETAKTRRQVLERIVPRLAIAPRCKLSGRFLTVRGELRTYKIHLGSGNILMEPNDEYLCIVPRQSAAAKGSGRVFLPFEGDQVLAVILSKAFMLAEDTRITDETIRRQIVPR